MPSSTEAVNSVFMVINDVTEPLSCSGQLVPSYTVGLIAPRDTPGGYNSHIVNNGPNKVHYWTCMSYAQ